MSRLFRSKVVKSITTEISNACPTAIRAGTRDYCGGVNQRGVTVITTENCHETNPQFPEFLN